MPAVKAILLPEGMTEIEARAFAQCADLRIIRIPDTITAIGENVFAGSPSVRIYCLPGSAAERYAIEEGIDYCNEE